MHSVLVFEKYSMLMPVLSETSAGNQGSQVF
jgi:hypothetical protein